MANHNQCISHDGVDTDLFELWDKAKSAVAEHRRLVLLTPAVCVLAGAIIGWASSHRQKWEASALVFAGATPVDELIRQSSSARFRKAILGKYGIALDTPDARLYLKTQKTRPTGTPNVIRVHARGYSRETVLTLVSMTAEELSAIDAARTDSAAAKLAALRKELTLAKKALQDINALMAKSQKNPSADSSEQALFIYLDWTMGNDVDEIQKQLNVLEENDEARANASAVPNKTYLWPISFGIFGVFLGIAIALTLSLIRSINKT